MRTLVDIPEDELAKLNRLSSSRKLSRAHLIRCAIREYVEREGRDSLDEVFGIWADRGIDALAYQEQMRREWERES